MPSEGRMMRLAILLACWRRCKLASALPLSGGPAYVQGSCPLPPRSRASIRALLAIYGVNGQPAWADSNIFYRVNRCARPGHVPGGARCEGRSRGRSCSLRRRVLPMSSPTFTIASTAIVWWGEKHVRT